MSATANNVEIDMKGVGHVAVDSLVGGDTVLGALTDAAVLRDTHEMPIARARAVEQLGQPTTMRAVAVAANFEMMNRLLDAIGVGPPTAMHHIGDDIGVPLPARFT